MKVFIARIVLVLVLVPGGASNVCVAQIGASTPAGVTLVDLRFISGLWRAELGGGLGEEHWSTSSGDSMIGTFRFVKDGKAQFYELMLIEQTAEVLVLILKHFNPGLIGWEEKAQVHSYPLTEYRQGHAVFERDDKKSRLTFRRTSKDALLVLLEQTADGKRNSEEFKFKLVK